VPKELRKAKENRSGQTDFVNERGRPWETF
jgi:hypothetical protein